jgi:transposase-like protein
MAMKKQYSPEFKAQVVREILTEEKTMAQIAAEYGVHPVQLSQWKKTAMDNLASLFVDERKAAKQQKVQEQKIERLYAQVGKLTTQLEWIKKKIWRRPGAGMNVCPWWSVKTKRFPCGRKLAS